MKARRHSLRISQSVLDDLTGLADGYTAKVELSVVNPQSKSARSLGRLSLNAMLVALNLKLVLVDDGAVGRLRRVPAPNAQCEPTLIAPPVRSARSLLVERGRKGGKATSEKLTPAERSAAASQAAIARWEKHRAKCSPPPPPQKRIAATEKENSTCQP